MGQEAGGITAAYRPYGRKRAGAACERRLPARLLTEAQQRRPLTTAVQMSVFHIALPALQVKPMNLP